MIKKHIIFCLFMLLLSSAWAQNFESDVLKGKLAYKKGQFKQAEHFFVSAYKQDSTNVDLLLMMLSLSERLNHLSRTAFLAKKLKVYLPDRAFEYAYIELDALFRLQELDKAEKVLNQILKDIKMNAYEAKKIERLAKNIKFTKEAVLHPVPFEPVNLGSNINSKYAEYLPVMTQDGRYLIYTRHLPRSYAFPSNQEDFYISENKSEQWTKSSPLSTKINTDKNEGAPSISADGKLFYFGACNRDDSKRSCDIYYTYNRGNYWTTPKNVKSVNTENWESQPNISADGQTLYFVSDRPGGEGGRDIWAADRISDGHFSEPYNLGKAINTSGDEISPFLHFDMQTLYFSSDGWPGMGSKDIFVSRLDPNGNWSDPKNLGYPINSTETDNSFFVDASGEAAYFSSKREGGYGQEDLYKIALYKEVRPHKTAVRKIVVLDSQTNKAIDVEYAIYSESDQKQVVKQTSIDGIISLNMKAEKEYKISLYANGFMFSSTYIDSIQNDSLINDLQTLRLRPISENQTFILENIEFDFDKASLRPISFEELKLFANYLNSNPSIRIQIEGHTDNVGNAAYNMDLSKRRAETVKQSLLEQGIENNRIATKGFGATQLLSVDKEVQQNNRRVVVRVLQY